MKRFKVVQDKYGNWGVLDTVDGEFAAWERQPEPNWGSFWPDALRFGIALNCGTAEIEELFWSTYRDR